MSLSSTGPRLEGHDDETKYVTDEKLFFQSFRSINGLTYFTLYVPLNESLLCSKKNYHRTFHLSLLDTCALAKCSLHCQLLLHCFVMYAFQSINQCNTVPNNVSK